MAGSGSALEHRERVSLALWVLFDGIETVASRLGASLDSVAHWMTGEHAPFDKTRLARALRAFEKRAGPQIGTFLLDYLGAVPTTAKG